MALTDQPYFPFYVDDYLSDEKLAECSAESEGIYIRLMCFMHKSEHYGKIKINAIDKAKHKQKASKIEANTEQKEILAMIGISLPEFAILTLKVQNMVRRDFTVVFAALIDLLFNGALSFDGIFLINNCNHFSKKSLYKINRKLWLKTIKYVFERDGFTCQYCGKKGGILEADHVVPKSKGGSDETINLKTSCRACNRSKGNKSLEEFTKQLRR